MRRITISLLALLALSTGIYAKSRALNIEDEKTMTVIVTNDGFEGSGRGTGIILDEKHVLTCAHMFQHENDTLFVYTYPFGRVIKAHIEGASKGRDVAILVLESSVTVKTTPVFQENVNDGDPITVIGNALGGMKWFVTRGVISGDDHDFLLTDALINPGNSGGPWFNAAGEIVAMTDWRIGPESGEHTPGLSGGISAKTINMILEQRRQANDISQILRLLNGG